MLHKGLDSQVAEKAKAGDRRQLRRKHLPDCTGCDYLAVVEEKHWKETAEQAVVTQEGWEVTKDSNHNN